jgi:hypothetical protein
MATTGPALYPGASTFPGTSVYPGQGDSPIVRCLLTTDDVSASTPNWTDVTADIRSYSVRRGRNAELEDFDAGTATVVLDNRDRSFDPTVNAAIRPRNRLWLFEEFSGETHSLIKSYANSWTQAWDRSGIVDATATVTASDEFSVLARKLLPASGTIPGAPPSREAQIGAVLDLVSSQAPRRFQATSIAGYEVAMTLARQSPLDLIRDIVKAEFDASYLSTDASVGAFFTDADGALVFLGGAHRRSAPYSTIQATFDDDGTDLPYLECEIDYSDSFLYNYATVTRTGGTEQVYSDAASIEAFDQRGLPLGDVALANDAVALILAQLLVTKHKDPFTRVTTIKPKMSDPNTAEAVYRLELMDRIRVLRTPPGGGARVDQTLFVQSIEHSGAPGVPPTCTLGVSPL